LDKELHEAMVLLPNLPNSVVPAGKAPEESEVVRTSGARPDLTAQKLPHWDLMAKYKLVDFELGTKITGSGFPVYLGQGAKAAASSDKLFFEITI